MTVAETPSAGRLLERGATELSRAGLDDARFQAEVLLRHALGWSRTSLLTRLQERVAPEASGLYFQLVERRLGRVPLQYIMGEQEFYGLSFRVTPAVLIPRPETEGVVDEAVRELEGRTVRVADVGCGSGCIGVAIAHTLSSATLIAVDQSTQAIAVARENAVQNAVEPRMEFLQGDLLKPVLDANRRVDAVVTNPPYIPDAELETLAPEVSEHEPRAALAGGDDGLRVISRLVPQVHDALHPGGWLFMEIGHGQREAATELVQTAGLETVRVVPDLAGIPRVVVARRRT